MTAIVIGIAVGLALGLTGGGGSIFAVPLLIYVTGASMHEAVPLSLVTVALTSLFGMVLSAKSRLVAWRAGIIFAVGGIVSAPYGSWLGTQLAEDLRLLLFSLLMLLVGISMWRKAVKQPELTAVSRASLEAPSNGGPICRLRDNGELRFSAPCALVLSAVGVAVGILAGLFGVGGGFLIVPALMTVTQMGAQLAVGTSLFAIAMIGLSGAISTVAHAPDVLNGQLDLALFFTNGSFLGMLLGRKVAGRLAGPALQKTFAMMVVATAIALLVLR